MVKYNGAVGLPVYDLPLVSNGNRMSISHHLAVTGLHMLQPLEKCSFTIGPKFWTTHTHPYPGAKSDGFKTLWVSRKASIKNEVDWFNIL